jgi:drug/metabolite transporter (DMT)-like permease
VNTTNNHQATRNALTGAALVAIAALGFSSKPILIKLAYANNPQVDAISLMALRMVLSLPFFLLAAFWRSGNSARHRGTDWGAIIALGLMGYYLASLLDFSSLKYLPANLERLILFLYPTLVILLSAVIYRKPVSPAKRRALLLSYAGMTLVFIRSGAIAGAADIPLGAALVFGSALVFALFLIGSGHVMQRFGSMRFTAYSMSVACIATLTHFAITRPLEQLLVSGQLLLLAVVLALFATVLPAFALNAGIQRIGAGRASIISAAGPVATLIMAWAILGETLAPLQLVGATMVLTGVLLISLSKETT